MKTEQNSELNWNDYAGDYIKPENVKEFPAKFVITNLTDEPNPQDNKKKILVCEVEYDKRKWKFALNKSNREFLQARFNSPKEIIGKILVLERVKVFNPQKQTNVWSLSIDNVE